jgi:hypothetical protein
MSRKFALLRGRKRGRELTIDKIAAMDGGKFHTKKTRQTFGILLEKSET